MRQSRLLALSAALGFAACFPGPLQAQTCLGDAGAVCVSQVGDDNLADIEVDGEGSGAIGGLVSAPLAVLGAPTDPLQAPVAMPLLDSNVVTQDGDGNNAAVGVMGSGNGFHVAQQGDGNSALQLVEGSGNSVAAVQGDGPLDGGNVSAQLQIGSGNTAYVKQAGSNNLAVQQQVPTAEAALLGLGSNVEASTVLAALAAGAWGSANNNSILLEQNGDNNEAYLTQIGSGHSIALRQSGNAQITITQMGSGKSISVEQPFGSQGIRITQR